MYDAQHTCPPAQRERTSRMCVLSSRVVLICKAPWPCRCAHKVKEVHMRRGVLRRPSMWTWMW
jgi:hypothetical protein